MSNNPSSLTTIGVFYDGNYFLHVSNYYNYIHERQRRISIRGLHSFIRELVAELEGKSNSRQCQIVDAHYFRGRMSASEASAKGNQLYYDRVFDDILMWEGVITHYLPLVSVSGRKREKGIDVWLALDAYELAMYKKFDVVVLIASDGDYVPLARKLNTLGTRVMVLAWEFEYNDDFGNLRTTRTSQDLLREVTYPILMHELIDNPHEDNSELIDSIFVHKQAEGENGSYQKPTPKRTFRRPEEDEEYHTSYIISLKPGYGFIEYPDNNLFFHYSEVQGVDFNELRVNDLVRFQIGKNEETGQNIAVRVSLVDDESQDTIPVPEEEQEMDVTSEESQTVEQPQEELPTTEEDTPEPEEVFDEEA